MTDSDGERRRSDVADEGAGCPVASRREFLRDAAIAVAGIAATLGFARTASALPDHLEVRAGSALRRVGNAYTYAIPATDGVQIDRDAEVIIVRWENAAYAFNLACPHQHTALRWDDADHRFQ